MKQITLLGLCLACSLASQAHRSVIETVLRGKIINAKTHEPVNAKVDIFRNSDFISAQPEAIVQGEFTAPLTDYGMYLISISAQGYVEATDTVWFLDENRKIIEKDFLVQPIEAGLTIALENIYFQFGRAELSEQSFPELDKTADFFQANPAVHFEIAGHTDRSGPAQYNLQLSKDRAQAVVNYLVTQGVSSSQLVARGYGETKPLRTELTKDAENTNRRVEFTVLKVE
jgi:OOP family OmpA-OmpF porin